MIVLTLEDMRRASAIVEQSHNADDFGIDGDALARFVFDDTWRGDESVRPGWRHDPLSIAHGFAVGVVCGDDRTRHELEGHELTGWRRRLMYLRRALGRG